MTETEPKIDTPVTRGDSRPVRYELIDKDGRKCGTYASLRDLDLAVRCLFPDQEQDEDRTGKGWDVQIFGCEP